MKRAWIEYTSGWVETPLTYWVHGDGREQGGHPPPEPWPVPGRGYPQLHVEFDDYIFVFSSFAEFEYCMSVLSAPLLPSTRTETLRRGRARGTHWLDAMPDWTKPWRYRERAVRYLRRARQELGRKLERALAEVSQANPPLR
jgi:hypothetical protein